VGGIPWPLVPCKHRRAGAIQLPFKTPKGNLLFPLRKHTASAHWKRHTPRGQAEGSLRFGVFVGTIFEVPMDTGSLVRHRRPLVPQTELLEKQEQAIPLHESLTRRELCRGQAGERWTLGRR
jgi:hypothetical protein